MLPSETMIWQPELTDKTFSRKPGAVQYGYQLFTSRAGCYPLCVMLPPAGDRSPAGRRRCTAETVPAEARDKPPAATE
ncbi:hypothetical protein FQE80_22855 [Escherichia coli]|nr:hypothetical protein [Escherichia coli]EGO7714137.1 hypothetical protein [Escherichia coli]